MNENKEKREFAQQLEQIAATLSQAVKSNEGRAFILIGTDIKDNKDGGSENVQGVIAVGGNGEQVIKGLANFFTEKQTAPLADEAMKLATLKKLSRLLGNE
ncbi:hypothetical protein QUW50_10045 [Barnesiella viscericola]|uniref:hypothetical protein n=1 Tax=Barnesiella viscericola TaxID=397865 RepID=UPI0025A4645B|nr:hypothetical protein [Barnesiella viscericola]MDM8269370.1 hypothetical protein [Barnesiella viscericola]